MGETNPRTQQIDISESPSGAPAVNLWGLAVPLLLRATCVGAGTPRVTPRGRPHALTDAIGPRVSGSAAEQRARDWVTARLRELGLRDVHLDTAPAMDIGGGVRLDPPGWTWTTQHVYLNGPDEQVGLRLGHCPPRQGPRPYLRALRKGAHLWPMPACLQSMPEVSLRLERQPDLGVPMRQRFEQQRRIRADAATPLDDRVEPLERNVHPTRGPRPEIRLVLLVRSRKSFCFLG